MPRRQTKGHDIRFWGSNYRMISNHTTQPNLSRKGAGLPVDAQEAE